MGVILYLHRDNCRLYHVPEAPNRRVHVLCKGNNSEAVSRNRKRSTIYPVKEPACRTGSRPFSPKASAAALRKHKFAQIKPGTKRTPGGFASR